LERFKTKDQRTVINKKSMDKQLLESLKNFTNVSKVRSKVSEDLKQKNDNLVKEIETLKTKFKDQEKTLEEYRSVVQNYMKTLVGKKDIEHLQTSKSTFVEYSQKDETKKSKKRSVESGSISAGPKQKKKKTVASSTKHTLQNVVNKSARSGGLTYIKFPEDDYTGVGRHIWETILDIFKHKTVGGFVTEDDIILHGGISVLTNKPIVNQASMLEYFSQQFEFKEGERKIQIKPVYDTTEKKWLVLYPSWL
jgi:hypothetical protein